MASAWDLGAALAGAAQEEFIRQIESSLRVESRDAISDLMMNWEQVRALKNAGHIIGGHTLSHPNLAHVTGEDARLEITGCKRILEERLADSVVHFSYPHPALNPQCSPMTHQIVRESGFHSAVLTTQGSVHPGDEPFALMRIPADQDNSYWLWHLERAFLQNHI